MATFRHETPVLEELAEELFAFWGEIFGPEDPDIPLSVFLGEETEHNRHVVWAERDGATLAGTCGMMTPVADHRLAGIGEVATRPESRSRGIAGRLCREALDEFVGDGGEAVFLGTENPDAARIYHRLGWRRIDGSTVWVNVTNGDSPGQYLAERFNQPAEVQITPGDASLRVPMIPLLLAPHDWQVLDANVPTQMISTSYANQNSCMGLYRRYGHLVKRDGATWFAAKTKDDRPVGIATAVVDDRNICHVDGFTHQRFLNSYCELIETAIEWGTRHGSQRFMAKLSAEDDEKRGYFERLGFRTGPGNGGFTVGDREVAAISMVAE